MRHLVVLTVLLLSSKISDRTGPGFQGAISHRNALYVRSHYDTVTAQFSDAPNRDEVVLIWAFATRGRLNARLGGLQASEVRGEDGLN